MDDSDLLDDPGAFAGQSDGDGSLPQDQDILPPEVLSPSFNPVLSNLENQLPSAMEDDGSDDSLLQLNLPSANEVDNSLQGATESGISTSLDPLVPSSLSFPSTLTNFLENSGSSLLSAFVTTPQNVKTAEGAALDAGSISSALSSQIFGYLLIGLVIFLVFQFAEKK